MHHSQILVSSSTILVLCILRNWEHYENIWNHTFKNYLFSLIPVSSLHGPLQLPVMTAIQVRKYTIFILQRCVTETSLKKTHQRLQRFYYIIYKHTFWDARKRGDLFKRPTWRDGFLNRDRMPDITCSCNNRNKIVKLTVLKLLQLTRIKYWETKYH